LVGKEWNFPKWPERKKRIDQCRAASIEPILATIVPVTKEHSRKKQGRLKGVIEYNN